MSQRFLPSLFAAFGLLLCGTATAQDIEYFEKKYGVKLPGVKPQEEYDDPDTYYSEIARRLDIPNLAIEAAAVKYEWPLDPNHKDFKITQAIIGRSQQSNWEILIFRFEFDPETKKPLIASMRSYVVVIDDDREVHSIDTLEEAKAKAGKPAQKTEPGGNGAKHEHKHKKE